MRGFFRFLFGLFFVITAYLLVLIFVLKSTLFNYSFIQSQLETRNAYQRIYEVIPEFTKILISKAEESELVPGEKPPLSGEQIGQAIVKSITPEILKQKTEFLLSGAYSWIYGKGEELPTVSFLDIKPKIEEMAAGEINMPVEYIRAGSSGFQVPEKIAIKTAPPLVLLRKIFSYNTLVMNILLGISLFSIIIVVLLSEDWAKRLKRPATPIIILSILLYLTAGLIWLFPNAGNLLFKEISTNLGASSASSKLLYELSNGIVNTIVFLVIKYASFMFVFGVIISIVGFIIKKRENNQDKPRAVD